MIDLYKCLPNLEGTIIFDFHRGPLETIVDNLNRVLSSCSKLKRFDCQIGYNQQNSASINEIIKRYPLFEKCSADTWQATKGYECRIQN
jgi:hypothetical protein